ncbi:MAG TPA: hypothetical protein VH105_11600 [Burkholderiales bacterium]|jgi:hypothetical protein|nr:hypothetical protein [Burkholderiales bacterium]
MMKLNKLSSLLGASLVASMAVFSAPVFAEATTGTAATTAHLDFTIVIPATLSFRVGALAAGISAISFTPTAAQLGTGALAATAASGDLGNGVVTASVKGNKSQITINAATTGALTEAASTNTIPWTQITTVATTLTSAAAILPAPVIPATGTGANVSAPAPVAGITTADARWTYSYANSTLPAAGTYGATVAKNGRVTYTASMP